jgi:hypothetical protein
MREGSSWLFTRNDLPIPIRDKLPVLIDDAITGPGITLLSVAADQAAKWAALSVLWSLHYPTLPDVLTWQLGYHHLERLPPQPPKATRTGGVLAYANAKLPAEILAVSDLGQEIRITGVQRHGI